MSTQRPVLALFILFSYIFAACEKPEQPIQLPAKGSSQHAQIHMGSDYHDQVFFDLERNQVVHTSGITSWDLAFEASENGFHIFMNGATGTLAYNTHMSSIAAVTTAPNINENEWLFDDPNGLPDGTGIGDWRSGGNYQISKNEVYIIRIDSPTATLTYKLYKKLRIQAATDQAYYIEVCDLNSDKPRNFVINKDPDYSRVYFTFSNGGAALQCDPPKDRYDFVFTRYRYVYRDLNNYTYSVNGALLNPYQTAAAADSTSGYENITDATVPGMTFSNARDIIGWDWKEYSLKDKKYTIFKNKCYVIRTRKDQYYKLHFLNFYDDAGNVGSPSFEYERLF